jgi:hypothetical protein
MVINVAEHGLHPSCCVDRIPEPLHGAVDLQVYRRLGPQATAVSAAWATSMSWR